MCELLLYRVITNINLRGLKQTITGMDLEAHWCQGQYLCNSLSLSFQTLISWLQDIHYCFRSLIYNKGRIKQKGTMFKVQLVDKQHSKSFRESFFPAGFCFNLTKLRPELGHIATSSLKGIGKNRKVVAIIDLIHL